MAINLINDSEVAGQLTVGAKLLMNNNQELRWKDSGGTERTILELTNSNDLYLGGSYAGSLFFMGGGSYTEKMKIDDSGNVLVQDNFNVGYTNNNGLNALVAFKKSDNVSNDANSRGLAIDYNLSGTTTQTGDRFYEGLLIDADSSATGGDTTNEVRFSGIRAMVEDSGDANDLYGAYFDARNDKTVANDTVANVFGTYSTAYGRHTAGEVKNIIGGYFVGQTDNADSGTDVTVLAGVRAFANQTADSGKTVANAYGVYGKVDLAASSNNGTFTTADGVYGEVEIDDADSTIGTARAVRGAIDSNAGTITHAYQFHGQTNTDGTITHSWGIYSTGAAKNYLDGTLQLGSYGSGSQTGTSAYYLISDSSGNIIEKTPAEVRADIGAGTGSGTVTGGGVANKVAYWSSSSALTYDNGFGFNGTNLTLAGDNDVLTIGTGGAGTTSLFAWTGDTFYIQNDSAGGAVQVETDSFVVKNNGASENIIIGNADGAVKLYYNASNKLETTTTGIDINGGFTTSASSDCAGLNMTADISMAGHDITLGGGAHVILDNTLGSGQASGTIIKHGGHMSALTAGKVYYGYASMTAMYWAQASQSSATSAKSFLAMSIGTDADVDGMLLSGVFYSSSHGFTIGTALYLSTSGNLTNTVPSTSNYYARVCGYALDANHIYFNPDNTCVKID